jgi:uncharacterized protein YceK
MNEKRKMLAALSLVGALALVPGAGLAQTRVGRSAVGSPWFPLGVGNQWVYTRAGAAGASSWKAEVPDRVTAANGRAYFALSGYFGPRRLVRAALSGAVSEYNPDGTYDNLWYLLGAPVGATWVLQLEPLPVLSPVADCISGSKAILASRTERVRVPAGEFADVVRVDYRSPCVDAGLTSEWFAPGVGLVRRAETSFAGAVVSELAQAEVGDLILPRLPYSTSLALDSPAYVNNLMPPVGPDSLPTVRGAFILRNRTNVPVEFTFSGCVSVRIEVSNEAGDVVLTAHANDGGCCLCTVLLPFRLVDDTLVVPVSFRLQTADGKPLPDGRYGVTATLNALESPLLLPAATDRIEVRSIY